MVPPDSQPTPGVDQDEPILETHEIQGNVVPGFNKSQQVLLALRITDRAAAKRWIRSMAQELATADEVLRFNELRHAMLTRRNREPSELIATWVNMAFSAPGLLALGRTDLNEFEDEAFRFGLPARATTLGDPPDANNLEGSPNNWKVGGTDETIPHILLILASDSPTHLARKTRSLKAHAERSSNGIKLIYEEKGKDLPGKLAGHEHFGFKDGISQPGIRGRMSDPPHPFLTRRLIADAQADLSLPEFARPGQPLVWPGEFVFGYQSQDPGEPRVPLLRGPENKDPFPSWARNGSYLVFRRLRQDVARFRQFLNETAAALVGNKDFDHLKATLLAAMLVGRWPSGAPVVRSPQSDQPALGHDGFFNNHFSFNGPVPDIHLVPGTRQKGDLIEGTSADSDGLVCPRVAHIRKVNPRDLTTEQGNNTDVLQRRILRRGIPFGTLLPPGVQAETDPLKGNRGLLFLCFQTSIVDQFEFLCEHWMNKTTAPEANFAGHDLIVGQNEKPGEHRDRQGAINLRKDGVDLHQTILTHQDWVIPTGGGYFFAPSISAIRDVLTRIV